MTETHAADSTSNRMAEVRELLFRCVGPEQMARLIGRVYNWAMEGNMAAVKLLFQYMLGKPVPMVTPDDDSPAPRQEGRAEPTGEAEVAAPVAAPVAPAPQAEAPAEAAALSPLERSHVRRAERRAAKKAARAARRAARLAG